MATAKEGLEMAADVNARARINQIKMDMGRIMNEMGDKARDADVKSKRSRIVIEQACYLAQKNHYEQMITDIQKILDSTF